MGNKKYFYRNKPKLSIALQALHLRKTFPKSTTELNKDIGLVWRGIITPTPLSQTYSVTIKYRLGRRPDVTITSPPLDTYGNEKIPHVFDENRLCLFRYKYFEWDSTMRIDETIIPWTSLWLFFYEIWLATGKWCGGGEHPDNNKKKATNG